MSNNLLSLLIWLPILGAVIAILVDQKGAQPVLAKWIGLIFSLITILLCVPLFMGFNTHTAQMQFVENIHWLPSLGINYSLGIDGVSALFIALTAFTNLIVILASWNVIKKNTGQYMAVFLLSTGIMNGTFSATNSILFYFFWEASMIPMLLGIGIWGGKRKAYASIKFFLYTFLGSIFMLVAFIFMSTKTGGFSIAGFQNLAAPGVAHGLSRLEQDWIFVAFLLAFAVKIPMWPVHTWLPDVHSEAPAGGSVVLAALMLKMGAYGFIRFSLPIVPNVNAGLDWLLIALSLIAIVYVGIACIVQKDMKRLIAYSSVSHMGLVTLGLFMMFMIVGQTSGHSVGNYSDAVLGVQGAIFQMIAHAFSSGALFIGVSYLFIRFRSRLIKDYKGLANIMPWFATFFMLFAMANVGLPGTSGFVGEFMIILAAIKANIWIALAAGMTLIIAPAYTLWLYKRVLFGSLDNPKLLKYSEENTHSTDLTKNEWLVMILLAIPVIVFGVYPDLILNISHATSVGLVHHVMADIHPGVYN